MTEGSPEQLKHELPAVPLLVQTPTPRKAQQVIRDLDGVFSSVQIGASLRVLVTEADRQQTIDQALRRAGINASVAPTDANLEDVFVAATHHQQAREGQPS
ncbi:hypothetical protein [Alcanivorax hongdengensis]|nr:hypothetical protein [Alcanivorax hongdengensis]